MLPSYSTIRVFTGVANIAGYCLYINRIARTTFAANVAPGVLRYDSTVSSALSISEGQIMQKNKQHEYVQIYIYYTYNTRKCVFE